MVGSQPDLVAGGELEEVGVHASSPDRVAAGELLDERLGELAALLDFDGGGEADAAEVGEPCRVLVVVGGHQQAGVELDGEVAEHVADGVQEGGLAVGAEPVEEPQVLGGDVAGEGDAGGHLHEADQLVVAIEDVGEELSSMLGSRRAVS